MGKILLPVPSYGFDPTEVAIPWKVLSQRNYNVVFATPDGEKASPDNCMLTGERLGIWKSALRARRDAVTACHEMQSDASFCKPVAYSDLEADGYDAIFLPGGHDKRIKDYLESTVLQQTVADFFLTQKPVAAICHGVVVAARSTNPDTGKSVIHNYKTTALLKSQERLAYNMTRLWLHDYYLTYPDLSVEDEVRGVLSDKNNFIRGPQPVLRDSIDHLDRGFVLRDRHYLSARWPGDVYNISLKFAEILDQPR